MLLSNPKIIQIWSISFVKKIFPYNKINFARKIFMSRMESSCKQLIPNFWVCFEESKKKKKERSKMERNKNNNKDKEYRNTPLLPITQFPQIKIILNGEKIKIYVWEIVKNCFYGAALYIFFRCCGKIAPHTLYRIRRQWMSFFIYYHVNGIKYVYTRVGMASNFYFPRLNDLNCYKNWAYMVSN